MKHRVLVAIVCGVLLLAGCGKTGVGGAFQQFAGNWAQLRLPKGCKAKMIAAEEGNGVAVLCADGRVFH